ncbi:MAG: MATE family efflux transporter, partial [Planctomycetaceae bacterium]
FNLNSLAFIPILGIGTAVMTIVGQRVGDGRPHLAVRSTWLAFGLSSVYMLAFAAVYLFLPELILAPYAMNGPPAEFARISETVVALLQFVALYSFFDGMAIVFGYAVRGAGDTRFSMIFSFLCGWLLMVLPTAIAWIVLGGDLWISWWACTLYIVVVGCGFLIRFQAGRWKSMRVIEPEPEPVLAPATGV